MSSLVPPLLGEPLALEFANTRFVARGHEHDGLLAPDDLAGWLRRVGNRLPHGVTEPDLDAIGPARLAAARDLREAIRTLLSAATARTALDPEAAQALNRVVAEAPEWHELTVHPAPALAARTSTDLISAALASIASDAVHLLGSPSAEALRACSAPGCVLFFRKDHPRRTCCSTRCSNRVRAARHYARRTASHRSTAP